MRRNMLPRGGAGKITSLAGPPAPVALKDPERILLIRMSHLGDVVSALPVFHALRTAHPAAEIGWVVQPEFAGLLDGLSGLQRTFLFERRRGLRAWLQLRRELAAFAPQLAVDAQGNLKSAAVTLLSGAGRRLGLHPSEWRERTGARVLTEVAAPSGGTHAIERMHALARHVSGRAARARSDPGLAPGELAEARAELGRLFPRGAGGLRILHLSAPSDVRAWPLLRFAELARSLCAQGFPVLCVSGPREEAEGLALARALAGAAPRHLVGQRDLRRLAALFAAAAEERGVFAGADSGPMHLACASGLPVVCLEGPQDGARTGPWTADGPAAASILRASAPPACAPCLRRRCHHPEGPVCMRGIAVADVAAALAAR
jgi:heptosyltransferase I